MLFALCAVVSFAATDHVLGFYTASHMVYLPPKMDPACVSKIDAEWNEAHSPVREALSMRLYHVDLIITTAIEFRMLMFHDEMVRHFWDLQHSQ